jgi:SAM-dependent methyltransferase
MNEPICNACGHALAPHLDDVKDPQSGERFRILRCPSCGLGHTHPEPADLGAYYGPAYYGGRHSFTARYCTTRRVRVLRSATRGAAPGNLLDIGCGDGSFLLGARDAGWTVAGTEIGGASEISKRAGLDVRGSLDETDDLAPFDVVTQWHTLEHIRDPRGLLAQVHARLSPQGTYIVAVPDAAGLQASVFGAKWFHLDVPRHLYHFDRPSLGALLDTAGFAVSRWHHVEVELDVFGWMQSALNGLVPTPNVLFQSLTGKARTSGFGELALSYALGTAIAPLAVAATAASAVTRRGATLIAIARKR